MVALGAVGVALLLAGAVAVYQLSTVVNGDRLTQSRASALALTTLKQLPRDPSDRVAVLLSPEEMDRWRRVLVQYRDAHPEKQVFAVAVGDPLLASSEASRLYAKNGVRRFVLGSGIMLAGTMPAIKEQRDRSRWACATWFSRRSYFKEADAVFRAHPGWEVGAPCIAALLAPDRTSRLYGPETGVKPALFGSEKDRDAASVLVVAQNEVDWRDLAKALRKQPQLRKVETMLVRPDHRDDRLMERLQLMVAHHGTTDIVCALGEVRMEAYAAHFPETGPLTNVRHIFMESVLSVRPRPFMVGQRCVRFGAALERRPTELGNDWWGHAPYAGALNLALARAMAPPNTTHPQNNEIPSSSVHFDVLQLQEVLSKERWKLASRLSVIDATAHEFVGEVKAPERLVRCRFESFERQGLRVRDLGDKMRRFMSNTCRQDSAVQVVATDSYGQKDEWRGRLAEFLTGVRMHVADSTRIRFEECRGGAQARIVGLHPGQRTTVVVGGERSCISGPNPLSCMWRQPVDLETVSDDSA